MRWRRRLISMLVYYLQCCRLAANHTVKWRMQNGHTCHGPAMGNKLPIWCLCRNRRSCRERLLLHNSRRKQRVEARTESLSDSDELTTQRTAKADVKAESGASAQAAPPAVSGWAAAQPGSQHAAGGTTPLAMAPPPRRARTAKSKAAGGSSREASDEQVCGIRRCLRYRTHTVAMQCLMQLPLLCLCAVLRVLVHQSPVRCS